MISHIFVELSRKSQSNGTILGRFLSKTVSRSFYSMIIICSDKEKNTPKSLLSEFINM